MKRYLLVLAFLCSLEANEEYLSKTQKEILKTKKLIIQKDSEKSRYDWLSPIYIKANITKANDSDATKKLYFSFDQDIYKSGGIRYGIKYANVLERLNLLGVDIEQRNLLKELFLTLIDIKINDLNIKQTKLEIDRIKVDIEIKKSKELHGYGNPTDLSDSIRTKNSLLEKLNQYENEKLNLINTINKISDIDYRKIPLPQISLVSKEEFLKNSTDIKYASINEKVKKYNHQIIKTNFLPKVSLSSQLGVEERVQNDGDYYSVGLTLSIPFDITKNDTNEKARLDYLKSKLETTNKKREILFIYQKTVNNINRYQNDIHEATKDIKIYKEDLEVYESRYKGGIIPKESLVIKEDDAKIRELDIDINRLKIQREVLGLYYMMEGDIK